MDLAPYLNPLLEHGASRAHGAWIEGHYPAADVAQALLTEFKRTVKETDVRTGWVRTLGGRMHFTNTKGRGAKPITWVEW